MKKSGIVFIVFLGLVITATSISLAQSSIPTSSNFDKYSSSSGRTAYRPTPTECNVNFTNEEILSYPTQNSVSLSVLPRENADIFVRYGPIGQPKTNTNIHNVKGSNLTVFNLSLNPDETYTYQVMCKKENQIKFLPRKEHTFKSLKDDASDQVSFAFVTDFHGYQIWNQWELACGDNMGYYRVLQTRDNIINRPEIDFVVLGGDHVQTQGCPNCIICTFNGEYPGNDTVRTFKEASLRYDFLLSEPIGIGKMFKEKPLALVMGNHDGEILWNKQDSPKGPPKVYDYSIAARLDHLPNAFDTYGTDSDGRYYDYTSGPVHIIVLDIMGHTPEQPETVDNWTIGTQQMQWLNETLKNSDKKWKILFMEHLDGGEYGNFGSIVHTFHYGRGSIKATDNNLPSGTWKGEQEQIHQLMKAYDAQVLFTGHDHVATIGEKQNSSGVGEGIYHIIGGSGSIGGPWINTHDYQEEMDFNNDGTAEFDTDITGTRKNGFMKVTANGESNLTIEYIGTDVNNEANNNIVVLTKVITE
jgi:hypothetical protein